MYAPDKVRWKRQPASHRLVLAAVLGDDFVPDTVETIAQEALGLSPAQAAELFYAADLDDLEDILADMRQAEEAEHAAP